MTYVKLDDQSGFCISRRSRAQVHPAGEKPHSVDWNEVFKLADLDPSQFQKAEPLWTSPGVSDERLAWTGSPAGNRLSVASGGRVLAWAGRCFSKWWGPGPNPPANTC